MKSAKLFLLAILAVAFCVVAPTACASTGSAVVGHSAAVWLSQCAGSTPLSFQWFKNGSAIPGATGVALPSSITLQSGQTLVPNSVYYIPTISATDAGVYTCVVTNSAGSTTSDTATLTVVVAPSGAITATWSN